MTEAARNVTGLRNAFLQRIDDGMGSISASAFLDELLEAVYANVKAAPYEPSEEVVERVARAVNLGAHDSGWVPDLDYKAIARAALKAAWEGKTTPTDIIEFAELAIEGGVPGETIYKAMHASTRAVDAEHQDLGRIGLGNVTGVRMVTTPTQDGVMISIENWGAYPFRMYDNLLHWSYVSEKLTPNRCDAVALTLVLGIILRRPVAVRDACDCPVHRDLQS